MGFNRNEVAELLVRCHRRCCVCHRYCGTKIETDHILPASESHNDSIENAIPVCFDCHAEIHAYNPKHPRGRRFTPDELRLHKEQWLGLCETRPEMLLEATRTVDIGPLQGLIDELDYNLVISEHIDHGTLGFLFRESQFDGAIREGALAILDENLRQTLMRAYGAISRANQAAHNYNNQDTRDLAFGMIGERTFKIVCAAVPDIKAARDLLLFFLQSESS